MRRYLHIPESLKCSLIKALLDVNIKYVIRSKTGIIAKGSVIGTVPSGSATKTTFGNTLRVVMYLRWAMDGLDFDHVIWVAGDDASVWFDPKHEDIVLKRMYERVYVRGAFDKAALG